MPVVGVTARKAAADSCEFFAPSCAAYSGNLLPSGSEEVAKNLTYFGATMQRSAKAQHGSSKTNLPTRLC